MDKNLSNLIQMRASLNDLINQYKDDHWYIIVYVNNTDPTDPLVADDPEEITQLFIINNEYLFYHHQIHGYASDLVTGYTNNPNVRGYNFDTTVAINSPNELPELVKEYLLTNHHDWYTKQIKLCSLNHEHDL